MSGCCMGYSASYCAQVECPSNPTPRENNAAGQMSALVDELRAGIPAYDVTQDGIELHDIDAAETLMSAAAAELTTLQSRLEAVKAERDGARADKASMETALKIKADEIRDLKIFAKLDAEAAEARVEAVKAERDAALAEIERMTPQFVAYDYLESPAGREIAEARVEELQKALAEMEDEFGGQEQDDCNCSGCQCIRRARALSPARTEEGKQ